MTCQSAEACFVRDGLDLISATDGAGAQTYFMYDGLGSTKGLTDGSANSVASYRYDVFGGIRTQTGSNANYWLFTGEQRDAGTGLYYLRARYYDPAIGRFLGQDPFLGFWSDPRTFNPYVYGLNDPVNLIDPYGLFGFKDIKKGAEKAYSTASTVTQYGDIVSNLLVYAPPVGAAFDVGAAIFAAVDIWTSCLPVGDKLMLTGLDALNLGVGLASRTNPLASLAAIPVEGAIYGYTTHYITDKCGDIAVAYASTRDHKE